MAKQLCKTCEKRPTCTKICPALERELEKVTVYRKESLGEFKDARLLARQSV